MRSTLRAAVVAATMVAVVATAGIAGAQTKTTIEPYQEIELQRLEETYAVLERFAADVWPGWTNFLEPEFQVQFPNLVFLIVGPRTTVPDELRIAAGLEARYKVSELRATHKAVIDKRDAAIALVMGRRGTRYVVDFERTKEFFDTKPRGKAVRLGVEQIFVNGIERLTLGDISLTSVDTPMHRPWLWTVEWVDTNAADGVRGYELTCRERAGSVCKGAEFKSAGFTLKAPEVEVAETGSVVRITILSKVAR